MLLLVYLPAQSLLYLSASNSLGHFSVKHTYYVKELQMHWNIHSNSYLCKVNKKQDIFEAALVLFVERGEQSTSMKCIAKKAQTGIGTMYNYFPSKDELINELYLLEKTNLFSHILASHDPSLPVKQQFSNTWHGAIDHALSHPKEYKFLELFAHSPKISKEVAEEVRNLFNPIIKIYEQGKKEGIIKNCDSHQLILFVNGAIRTSILGNPQITKQKIDTVILMAWDAIKN
ncbi:MAG: TetR family transcriptional regulator [Bacteroidales bacterium]|nr:TetR family transcriptional regulator [Bacteroidales bacterium]